MKAMGDTWTDRLSDYLDGDLAPGEQAALEAHLAGCAACRTALAELRQVVARAGALASHPPAADLWPGVAARIGSAPAGRVTPLGSRRGRLFSFTLPQLVAASLALMVLSGGAVWIAQHGGRATTLPAATAAADRQDGGRAVPAALADPYYDEAVADLEQALEEGRSSFDPQTIKVLEDNLEAIDRAIAECRDAIRSDPANVYLNSHLAEAKQRKLLLLRRATALASTKGS